MGEIVAIYIAHCDLATEITDATRRKYQIQAANVIRLLAPIRASLVDEVDLDTYFKRRIEEEREVATRGKGSRKLGKPSRMTARNELELLRRALVWAKKRGLLPPTYLVPPAISLKRAKKGNRKARRLTESEVAAIIRAGGYSRAARLQGLPELLTCYGWSGRRGEALFNLRRSHAMRLLDETLPRAQRIVFWEKDKTEEAEGWAPVTEPAYAAIRRRLAEMPDRDPGALLWRTTHGRRWVAETFATRFRKIRAASEVDNVKAYDLRKHACAQLLAQTLNPHVCIEYTGHADPDLFLRTYSYALPGAASSKAAEVTWTGAHLRALDGGKA